MYATNLINREKHRIRTSKLGKENISKAQEARRVKVVDSATGKIFNSITEAALYVKYSPAYTAEMLRGGKPNKTTLQYFTETYG